MAVTLKYDLLADATIEEELGAYSRVIRRVHVAGLTPGASMAANFQAMESAGLPTVNSALSVAHPSVVLRSRRCVGKSGSPGQAFVILEYVQYHDNPNGSFIGGADLQQQSTQVDNTGNPISVSHTYISDPDFGNATYTQGADVTAEVPAPYLRSELELAIDYPLSLVATWSGSVNSVSWGGLAAHQWLCTSVEFKPIALQRYPASDYYLFTFQFHAKLYSIWDPLIFFRDSRTGQPPSGLVAGVGYKTISAYRAIPYATTYPYFLA